MDDYYDAYGDGESIGETISRIVDYYGGEFFWLYLICFIPPAILYIRQCKRENKDRKDLKPEKASNSKLDIITKWSPGKYFVYCGTVFFIIGIFAHNLSLESSLDSWLAHCIISYVSGGFPLICVGLFYAFLANFFDGYEDS